MILPDPTRSRAVLIGVSGYTKMPSLPTVRNNVEALRYTLTGSASWNLPFEHCNVVHDPSSPEELVDPILEAAEEATDTLLVYYAGHGMKGQNRGELRLTRATSRPGAPHTATHYDDIRDIILDSPASRRLVILDCCYAASALGTMAGPGEDMVEDAVIEGTYLIAAAGETEVAMAQGENGFTVFTGELLKLLRNGLSTPEPMLLDLNTVFTHVDRSLRAKSRPRPRRRIRDSPGDLAIGWNRRWLEQQHSHFLKRRRDGFEATAAESSSPAAAPGTHTGAGLQDPYARQQGQLPVGGGPEPAGGLRPEGSFPFGGRGPTAYPAPHPAGRPPAALAPAEDTVQIRNIWPAVIESIKNRRRFAWILLAQNARPLSYGGGVLRLGFQNPGSRDTFYGADVEKVLKEALREDFSIICEIDAVVEAPADGRKAEPPGGENPPGDVMRLVVGDEISHASFGRGTVISVSGEGNSSKVAVDFDELGRKNLLLRYAPVTRI